MNRQVALTMARKLIAEHSVKNNPDNNKIIILTAEEEAPEELNGALYIKLAHLEEEQCTT